MQLAMPETLANHWQRKVRSLITLTGVLTGAFALTVMGGMSEKIHLMTEGALDFYNSRIIVQPRFSGTSGLFGAVLSADFRRSIEALPGVSRADPVIYLPFAKTLDERRGMAFMLPPLIKGINAAHRQTEGARDLNDGRWLDTEERRAVVLGADLARAESARVGEPIMILGQRFMTVGLLEQSLSPLDRMAFIRLADAQELMVDFLPLSEDDKPAIDPEALASHIEVFPSDLADAPAVANEIEQIIDGVEAVPPGEMAETFRESQRIFDVIVFGSAVVAALVGALAVLNTMIMSVAERKHEIGVKRAVGASSLQISFEFLREAALIGSIGGVLGLAAGALAIEVLNAHKLSDGTAVFVLTLRLCIFVPIATTVLGVLAGILPALAAARLDPVACLRQV